MANENIKVACPNCASEHTFKAESIGKKAKCSNCSKVFVIEAPAKKPAVPSKPPKLKVVVDDATIVGDGVEAKKPEPKPDDVIKVVCGHCKELQDVKRKMVGKTVRCGDCNKDFEVSLLGVQDCPDCGYTAKKLVAAGKKQRCEQCRVVFVVEADEGEEAETPPKPSEEIGDERADFARITAATRATTPARREKEKKDGEHWYSWRPSRWWHYVLLVIFFLWLCGWLLQAGCGGRNVAKKPVQQPPVVVQPKDDHAAKAAQFQRELDELKRQAEAAAKAKKEPVKTPEPKKEPTPKEPTTLSLKEFMSGEVTTTYQAEGKFLGKWTITAFDEKTGRFSGTFEHPDQGPPAQVLKGQLNGVVKDDGTVSATLSGTVPQNKVRYVLVVSVKLPVKGGEIEKAGVATGELRYGYPDLKIDPATNLAHEITLRK